jgi:hypothetical protein
MAKPKKKPADKEIDEIEDLVELFQKLNVAEDAFNGDLFDACDSEADLMKENIAKAGLYEQL